MNSLREYIELKRSIISVSNTLIQEGIVENNYEKWFVGNSLGTVILAAESEDDMKKLADFFYEFCESKRREFAKEEAEDMQKLASRINNMPIHEFKGIEDLLSGTGVCLN